ncbi:hypothetical protein BDV28DRAFT_101091 [Aspergillus coremiiformis]|uniref:Uncharacterized protein n=1 Tax=Aspergillus coremiiformis TaxID=138285 RepID=A0A5N6ZCC3_9EURO|nr:hypothetical protein BDV28DRAFT_101091 [Aspergillus coremiiformis]
MSVTVHSRAVDPEVLARNVLKILTPWVFEHSHGQPRNRRVSRTCLNLSSKPTLDNPRPLFTRRLMYLKLSVTTVFPSWGGPVYCLLSLDICGSRAQGIVQGI